MTHITPYGLAECAWKIAAEKIDLNVIIPANTTAVVTLPGADQPFEVGSGSWDWSVPYQDPAARDTVMDVLDRMEAPGFLRMVIFSERNIPLRQVLEKLPNHKDAVTQMNDALASL